MLCTWWWALRKHARGQAYRLGDRVLRLLGTVIPGAANHTVSRETEVVALGSSAPLAGLV